MAVLRGPQERLGLAIHNYYHVAAVCNPWITSTQLRLLILERENTRVSTLHLTSSWCNLTHLLLSSKELRIGYGAESIVVI